MYIITILIIISLYYSYRYAWWRKEINYTNPRILMYHMISDHKKNAKFNGLRVNPKIFEKQICYLKENGWTFYTMSELIREKNNLPLKSIAITFDDGYEDNYTNAFKILKKYNAKATIYIVVDRHNREWSSKRKAKNSNGELKDEPKLTDAQVKKLLESGLIEIGSHTMTHDNLPNLTLEEKKYEIVSSKKNLEQTFKIKCNSFCYPFGLYDKEDIDIVKKASYTNATTTTKGISKDFNIYELKRVTISGKDNFFAFKIKMKIGQRGIKK